MNSKQISLQSSSQAQVVPSALYPQAIQNALEKVHASWIPAIHAGLHSIEQCTPGYLAGLKEDEFLPDQARLFAAFAQPVHQVRYVLVGEGPYPRPESATGVCFMDGAVNTLWSEQAGLSKSVNRATSLRNFIKMLLVTEGLLQSDDTGISALTALSCQARQPDSELIATLPELQSNLEKNGFLLLNASLVFRLTVAPKLDAQAWLPFLQQILRFLLTQQQSDRPELIKLVLWGKIAELLKQIEETAGFTQLVSEHPYNLSFIQNQTMQRFFAPFQLMKRSS